jgi:hypothetical protein
MTSITRTRNSVRPRALLAAATALAAAAALFAPLASATPVPSGSASAATPQTQGIIMRDGGVCDPIRHMGC